MEIREGSVVTIVPSIKLKNKELSKIKDKTGTVYWVHDKRVCVILPCGTLWYGKVSDVYIAQYDTLNEFADTDYDNDSENDLFDKVEGANDRMFNSSIKLVKKALEIAEKKKKPA